MPEIYGTPLGTAVRHLGLDPEDWRKRMELRAQVVSGLETPAKRKTRRKRDGQAADGTRKDVR